MRDYHRWLVIGQTKRVEGEYFSFTKRGDFIDVSEDVTHEVELFDESEEVDEVTKLLNDDGSFIETKETSMKHDISREDKVKPPKYMIPSKRGVAIKLMRIDGQYEVLLDEWLLSTTRTNTNLNKVTSS